MEHSGWNRYYPRPQLRRDSFFPINEGWTLNGRPIRVPWPPQAPLSGWEGEVGDVLRYETAFTLPDGFAPPNHRVLLHFGAVDQVAEVWVNGTAVIRHEGGYLPFSADVTDALRPRENRLEVKAVDTLSHDYPYGKQHKRPHGMWYTPVSGIWQSVWLEAVPERGTVASVRITPDLTGVTVEVDAGGAEYTVSVALGEGRSVTAKGKSGVLRRLSVPQPHLWTPDDPYLYSMTVTTETDRVESYFALRTVTTREVGGHTRLCLNGEPIFLHGVLDQGYFRDGLFLPKEPEEYERDVLRMKELGFNTLRKHIKVEPEAFYYACDRLGMLVVQDMVNSGEYRYVRDTVVPTLGYKKRNDLGRGGGEQRKAFFERHCLDTVAHLANHPCIVGWTIFNEGWGQYDSDRIYRLLKPADPTRFFMSTSGWFAQNESDVQSEHVYFNSRVLEGNQPGRFLFLSECGGFSRRVEGHVTQERKNYGYGERAESEGELTGRIQALYDDMVLPSIPNGLCGCVYTQLSDVEGETNGLYTYDRAVRKVSAGAMKDIARRVEEALSKAVENG
ncbi:MAG: glycoside hydrolase family 2 [Oscillospiraceae bacterium]|nr:glycoside hydrolase family 2 [Oscillospiraceae bacterium]